MQKRLLLLILTVLLVTAGTAGWLVSQKEQPPLTDLWLAAAMHSVYYAPQYVALHQNYFSEQGLNVQLTVAAGDAAAAKTLSAGKATVALFSSEQAVLAHAASRPASPVAFALLCRLDGTTLMARTPAPFGFSWREVSGQTLLGCPPEFASRLTLDAALENQGVAGVVISDHLSPASSARFFAAGSGDYWQAYEPDCAQFAGAEMAFPVAELGEQTGPLPLAVYHTTPQAVKQQPALLQQFTNALYRAQCFVQNEPASKVASVIAPSFPDQPLSLLTAAVAHYQRLGVWASTPVVLPELADRLQELLIATGRLRQAVDLNQSLDNSFATRAIEGRR